MLIADFERSGSDAIVLKSAFGALLKTYSRTSKTYIIGMYILTFYNYMYIHILT